jgi:hypothetical protein
MATPKILTNNDLIWAATRLDCDLAAIRAVDEVESNGRGFRTDGSVVIRFETHVFLKYTGKTVTGSGQAAYDKAYAINPMAAMLSTSWGRYQIMGFNYKVCGYTTVEAFVAAMKSGERKQLEAFVAFVIGNNLDGYLRAHDWARLAYGYNGAGYKAGKYDTKLATAHKKFSGLTLPATDDPAPMAKK